VRSIRHQHQRQSPVCSGERCEHLAISIVSGVEVVWSFVFFWLEPIIQMMKISLAVQFDLGARMKSA
jgi:hypothetical protein